MKRMNLSQHPRRRRRPQLQRSCGIGVMKMLADSLSPIQVPSTFTHTESGSCALETHMIEMVKDPRTLHARERAEGVTWIEYYSD
eukprot:3519261-Amphidinium_carterae.2